MSAARDDLVAMHPTVRRGVLVFAWSYALAAGVFLLLRWTTSDDHGVVLLATQVAHLWLAPAPFLLLGALLVRRRRLAAVALVLFVALIADCGTWLVPARQPLPTTDRPELRVLSWNLAGHHCEPAQVAAWVSECDADVVILQESRERTHAALAEALGADYAFHGQHNADRTIESKAWFVRTAPQEVLFVQDAVSARVQLIIDFDGAPLHIWNLHPDVYIARDGPRSPDHARLIDLAEQAAVQGSSLLVGDFNSSERSPLHARLRAAGLVDSFREAGSGPGFGFPCNREYFGIPAVPLVRIDYAWHTVDLECTEVRVGPAAGSDHRALLTVFRRSAPVATD